MNAGKASEAGYSGPLNIFPVPYSREIFNFHWFNFYNAICFQIILGAPTVLLAKNLGANSVVLGVIASFTPLMTVLQLPAAHYLKQHSYRSFALLGWALRSVFIATSAIVPLLAFASHQLQLTLLLGSLFFFNLLRGISSAAFLPWLSNLVGSGMRGRFLAIDHTFINGASLLTMLLCAMMMHGHVESYRYSLLLWLSVIGSMISLHYLSIIPDIKHHEEVHRSASKVSWREMFSVIPFRNALFFNLLFATVAGGLGVFPVEYLRVQAHFSPSMILALSAANFLGALLLLQPAGKRVDRFGSIPIIRLALILFALVLSLWFAMSAGMISHDWRFVLLLNFIGGGCVAMFNMANTHLCLTVVPKSGKNHFFAVATVISSLAMGVVPILWGSILDLLGNLDVVVGPCHLRRHSIYFLGIALLCFATLIMSRILRESRSISDDLELLPDECF